MSPFDATRQCSIVRLLRSKNLDSSPFSGSFILSPVEYYIIVFAVIFPALLCHLPFYQISRCGVIPVFNVFATLCPCAHAQSLVNCSPRPSRSWSATLPITTWSIPFCSSCCSGLVVIIVVWSKHCVRVLVRIQATSIIFPYKFSSISLLYFSNVIYLTRQCFGVLS